MATIEINVDYVSPLEKNSIPQDLSEVIYQEGFDVESVTHSFYAQSGQNRITYRLSVGSEVDKGRCKSLSASLGNFPIHKIDIVGEGLPIWTEYKEVEND